ALSGFPDLASRLLVYINLACYEKEVVPDAMNDDSSVNHPNQCIIVSIAKQQIPDYPGRHAHNKHLLYPKSDKKERHQKKENAIGYLSQRHFSCRVVHANLKTENIRKSVIEGKRDAY